MREDEDAAGWSERRAAEVGRLLRSMVEDVPASSISGGEGTADDAAVVPVVSPGCVSADTEDEQEPPLEALWLIAGTRPAAWETVAAARRGSIVIAPTDLSSIGEGGRGDAAAMVKVEGG